MSLGDEDIKKWGVAALVAESDAVRLAAERLDSNFCRAVTTILDRSGRVVLTGLGKSGHVARKVASTLSSTGTPAFFLHPSEAQHGDLGMLQPDDTLLAVAFGGETPEVLDVAKYARRLGVPVIAITGKKTSSLGHLTDVLLDGHVVREACPLNLAPTSSSTVALAMGDAVAIALMQARDFKAKEFAAYHPGGSLGKKLSLVADHMRAAESMMTVQESSSFHDVLLAVTKNNYGVVAVTSALGAIVGSVSDGDVRRLLLKRGGSALSCVAAEMMSSNPKTISPSAFALDAVKLMERHQITSLFVADDSLADDGKKLRGLIRMHDLLAAKVL